MENFEDKTCYVPTKSVVDAPVAAAVAVVGGIVAADRIVAVAVVAFHFSSRGRLNVADYCLGEIFAHLLDVVAVVAVVAVVVVAVVSCYHSYRRIGLVLVEHWT